MPTGTPHSWQLGRFWKEDLSRASLCLSYKGDLAVDGSGELTWVLSVDAHPQNSSVWSQICGSEGNWLSMESEHRNYTIKILNGIRLRYSDKLTALTLGFYCHLYEFARATITKYQRLNGLDNRNVFCHDSRGWKSKKKVPAGLVSLGVSLLGWQVATLFFYPLPMYAWYLLVCSDFLFL